MNAVKPLLLILFTLTTLAACGGGGGSEGGASASPASTNPSSGLQQRPRTATLNVPVTATSGEITMVEAFENLPNFSQPVFITHAGDGSDRLFVVEQAGRIRVFANDPNATSYSTFLDIRDRVADGGELGLLGLAFDPNYASNGYFYVYYTGSGPESRLSRFNVSSGNPNQADPGSETILLTLDQPAGNHNGGTIAFGPDGYLYWGLGDGGGSGDPDRQGQNTQNLLSTVMRINPTGSGYSIPADNPFVDNSDGIPEEIWAYGFRNPYRFSFDRNTGDLWLADVGQNAIEEIDIVIKGGNYGWSWYEGSSTFRSGAPSGTYQFPVHEYDHSQGESITGGYVYRGSAVPSLVGKYLYGDFISTRVWALTVDDQLNKVDNSELGNAPQNPAGFGEDEAGELYIAGYGGRLYRFAEGDGGDPLAGFPQALSDTGLFSDTSSLTPASGLIEYDVNSPLWSDYSTKRRWIAVPNGQAITFSGSQPWRFPIGTVLVKHFEMEMVAGDTDSSRRLETRVLVNQTGGWFGVTYRWNEPQTDAELLTDRLTETLTVADADFNGGTRVQDYLYPSPNDCLSCHVNASGNVLGVKTAQLNGRFDYTSGNDTISANQLTTWNHIGLFTRSIGSPGQYQALRALDNQATSLDQRSRSYLDSNCSFCHQAGGTAPVNIDLRYSRTLAQTNTLDVVPEAGDLGISGARIIASGDAERSVLWARMNTTDDQYRMPPIASHLPHPEALNVIQQWIESL